MVDDIPRLVLVATRNYDTCVRSAHSALVMSNLTDAFGAYASAVGYAYRITLLLSDDDTAGTGFWRNEMGNVQQLCTALAVLLKAREMQLPTPRQVQAAD